MFQDSKIEAIHLGSVHSEAKITTEEATDKSANEWIFAELF
jgi:hypothetical protein